MKVTASSGLLLDYSKTIIPTGGQATLHSTHRGKPYDVVVQVITSENYNYAPLLGLADSACMGILNYDFDVVNQLQAFSTASLPLCELKLESIKPEAYHLEAYNFDPMLGFFSEPIKFYFLIWNIAHCTSRYRLLCESNGGHFVLLVVCRFSTFFLAHQENQKIVFLELLVQYQA